MAEVKRHYELNELIEFMKQHKILKLELGSTKLELDASAFDTTTTNDMTAFDTPDTSAEELLYWSSGEGQSNENM